MMHSLRNFFLYYRYNIETINRCIKRKFKDNTKPSKYVANNKISSISTNRLRLIVSIPVGTLT